MNNENQNDQVVFQNGDKKYVIQKQVGKGMFGIVYQASSNIQKHPLVAIKVVNMGALTKQQPDANRLFQAEVQIQNKIQNNNVVAFIDYFEQEDFCYLVQELCNQGDLDKYIKENPVLEDEQVIEFFKQLVNGIKGMHEHNIIHRDLKLPNILIHNGQLKIADLGFAKQLKNSLDITKTILGTPYTMAPEVLEQKSYGLQADMFSLGVILYQMIFKGKYPFSARSPPELLLKIKQQIIVFKSPHKNYVDPALESLVRTMLQYDVHKRIKWRDLYNHAIFDRKYEEQYANKYGTQNLYSSQIQFKQNEQFYSNQIDDGVNKNILPDNMGFYPVQSSIKEENDNEGHSIVQQKKPQFQELNLSQQNENQKNTQNQIDNDQNNNQNNQNQPQKSNSQDNSQQNSNQQSANTSPDKSNINKSDGSVRKSSYLQNDFSGQSNNSSQNKQNSQSVEEKNSLNISSLQIQSAQTKTKEKTPTCQGCFIF